MTVNVFLYNVVPVKADLTALKNKADTPFILIGSHYCLSHLSAENKGLFDEIHPVHNRSFHQIHHQEVEHIVLSLIERYGAKNLRLLSNEDSTQLVCAQLREQYGIPGNSLAQVLPYVNKLVSKNKLQGQLRTPRFTPFEKKAYQTDAELYINEVIQSIGFPMFIKPVDLVSSIDTFHIPDEASLRAVFAKIVEKPWDFEIDEFIEGELFHCDVIVRNNRSEFFMAGQYAWPLARFSKGSPMGSIPVNDDSLLSRLKDFTERVLNALGRFSSAFHIEVFKHSQTGELIFLEAAARTPGAMVPDMYKMIMGRHLEELHYHVQLFPEQELTIEKPKTLAGWITFPKIEGTLSEIRKPELSVNYQFLSVVKNGDSMEQAASLLDSACSILFWDDCFHNISHTFEYLRYFNPLTISASKRPLSGND
ncbi:ATP-grasp domain-containing protein [Legionella quinlivanii]|uniref:ATP-grasp domain-containing protein n=1 Tax=Legionella quinlivanii TaxID=45073 RepID=UPI002242F5B5|nr:hypothetical protein [Legionella quinlivanii]MCW8449788.1 hypothetical protein [Legionella quinlivanii]